MEVDTSDYAIVGVLLMECENNLWRPVAFLSKSLNEMERNYEIHDKEMLAIIRGLEAWRHFVKIKESRLDLFYFSFHFYFLFNVFFYFLFLKQLGLGLIGHAVTSVTS